MFKKIIFLPKFYSKPNSSLLSFWNEFIYSKPCSWKEIKFIIPGCKIYKKLKVFSLPSTHLTRKHVLTRFLCILLMKKEHIPLHISSIIIFKIFLVQVCISFTNYKIYLNILFFYYFFAVSPTKQYEYVEGVK